MSPIVLFTGLKTRSRPNLNQSRICPFSKPPFSAVEAKGDEMVLSNKKLKQKLRSLVVESLANAESDKSPHKDHAAAAAKEEVNQELQSVKELLVSKSRQSKREKRRKKPPLSEDSRPSEGGEEAQRENGENGDQSGVKKEKKKKKKRKRENEEGIEPTQKKPKKKKKQKKKKKKEEVKDEREDNKNEKNAESADGESTENGVMEPVKVDESELKKVFVGGIPYYSTEDDIRSFFEHCGTITEVDCMTFPESGKFRGIAILSFKTEAAGKRALALDGADMGGFYLKIQSYKANRSHKSDDRSDFAPEIVEGYNRIYVGNLTWDITEDDLKQFFSDCKVSSIRFGMDKETGEFKGYAHVDFSDTVSLTVALKLDQKVVCGRPVRIRCAVPKKGGRTNPTTNSGVKSSSSTNSGVVKKTENGESAASWKKKKKRQTCYECGVPGHLSSACPRKKAVQSDASTAKS